MCIDDITARVLKAAAENGLRDKCVCCGKGWAGHELEVCSAKGCRVTFHATCTKTFKRSPGTPMHCPACAAKDEAAEVEAEDTRRKAAALRASTLPETNLSMRLESDVYKHLDKLSASGGPDITGLCVRELEHTATAYELPKELCQAYANDRETRRQLEMLRHTKAGGVIIPCHRVAFGLFQNSPRDGEHLEFFVQATEFGPEAPAAFRGTLMIDWVDSAQLLDIAGAKGKERPLLYQALLTSYVTLRQEGGFRMVLLAACAPQYVGEPHSWVLRRNLPLVDSRGNAISDSDTQDRLLAWYQLWAAALQAAGIVVAPAPRAHGVDTSFESAIAKRWDDQDTLGRLAEERLAAGDHSLDGVPLFENALLEAAAHTMNAKAQALSGTQVEDLEGSNKRSRPLPASAAAGTAAQEALYSWTQMTHAQCDVLILRLAGHCHVSSPPAAPGPSYKARRTEAGSVRTAATYSAYTRAEPDSSAVPVEEQEEQEQEQEEEEQEDVDEEPGALAPVEASVRDLLAAQGLRFDTHALAVFATRQLLLWLQPAGFDDPLLEFDDMAMDATASADGDGVALGSVADAAEALSGVAPAVPDLRAACFALDGPPALAPAPWAAGAC